MATKDLSMKRVTMAEIARAAGVSVGLVSSYLSGKNYADSSGSGIRISVETASRIMGTCRQLNYQPERAETYRMIYPERAPIGLVGNVRDQFQLNRYHSLILDGAVAAASAAAVSLSLLQYDPDTDYAAQPELLPDWVQEGHIGKFLFAGPPNHSLLRILVERGARIVYASRDPGVAGVSAVVPDYRQAAGVAIRFLHEAGHRRIGLFGLSYFNNSYPGQELAAGAQAVLDELHCRGHLALNAGPISESKAQTAHSFGQLFRVSDPVTAVFAFDDLSAEYLAHHAIDTGLQIPRDLSVVGCNDERQAALMHPPLTTIRLPVFEIGRQAVELVNQLAAAGGDAGNMRRTLPVALVERASTARCR
jgi:LacI family transcriptional regulator